MRFEVTLDMADLRAFSRSPGSLRNAVKQRLNSLPLARTLARYVYFGMLARRFTGSAVYWEQRYRAGEDSGAGSYGRLAKFKADVLNEFVRTNAVETVIELGCGDGAQLSLAQYPRYHGVDVSPAAVERCLDRFRDDRTKTFALAGSRPETQFDLALSLDVIYHLVEDDVFESYMDELFASARRYVIIYSSNYDVAVPEPHMRHRNFTNWVNARQPQWRLARIVPNRHPFDATQPNDTSFADFFIFERYL